MTDFELMGAALDEARKAAALGEVPVGAVVAKDGEIIAAAHNTRVTDLFAQPFNHHPVIEKGLRADEAQQLLQAFFVSLRAKRAAKPRWKPPVAP